MFSTVPLPVFARLVPAGPAGAHVLERRPGCGSARWSWSTSSPADGPAALDDVRRPLPARAPETPVTRLSEPANYRVSADDPADRTRAVRRDPVRDRRRGVDGRGRRPRRRSCDDACGVTGLPPDTRRAVVVKRLRHVYPVYEPGYEAHLAGLDGWAASLPRVTTFGRLGLFAHDNTHHAMAMAYDAVARWARTARVDRGRVGGRPGPVRRPRRGGLSRGRVVQLAVHRRQDPAQVAAEPDEAGARLAEGVGDGHLGVAVALAEQVQRQHLRVVVVVHDLGRRRQPRGRRPGSRSGRR